MGGTKVCLFTYADNIVLVARNERVIKEMMRSLENYMEQRKLMVNVLRGKVIVFRKGGERRKVIECKGVEEETRRGERIQMFGVSL